MFHEYIYKGAIIQKPNKTTFITQVDNDGFRYKIGEKSSKKVLFDELKIAISTLNAHKFIDRQWFNKTFGKRAEYNPCNYTTIGGVLINMDLVYYDKGRYIAK